ncbi:MAG: hypothetical protein WC595_00065 [Candidatus Nanoarchaeia archaeon]
MKIENHYKRLKENYEVIEESLKKDLKDRQSTLGFSVSAASIHLIEIYLHQLNLIDSSFLLKHEWFKSKNKLAEKLSFNFPEKEKILHLLKEIQEKRNDFCYGPPKKEGELLSYLETFNQLKKVFEQLGVDNEK